MRQHQRTNRQAGAAIARCVAAGLAAAALAGCGPRVEFLGTECFYDPDEHRGDAITFVSSFQTSNLTDEQLIYRVRLHNRQAGPLRSVDGRYQDPDGCVAASKSMVVHGTPWTFEDTRVSIPADQIGARRADLPLTAVCLVTNPAGEILASERVRFAVPDHVLADTLTAEDAAPISKTKTKLADSRAPDPFANRLDARRSPSDAAEPRSVRRPAGGVRPRSERATATSRGSESRRGSEHRDSDATQAQDPASGDSDSRVAAADRRARASVPQEESRPSARRESAADTLRSRSRRVAEPRRPTDTHDDDSTRLLRDAKLDTDVSTEAHATSEAPAPSAPTDRPGPDESRETASAGKRTVDRDSDPERSDPRRTQDGWDSALDNVQRAAMDAEASKRRRPASNRDTRGREAGRGALERDSSTQPADGWLQPLQRYTVKRGDTLRSIASKTLGNPARWREIFDLNQEMLNAAGRLTEGMELELPLRAPETQPRAPK